MRKTACLIVASLSVIAESLDRKPHIVFVLADDYGWGNIGVHRRTGDSPDDKQARLEWRTPNLDALVDDGILIDRHYAYKICSPSRSSLQSGRLAVHVNTKNTGVTVHNATDPVSGYAGIPRNMTGLAQKLLDSGYRTHMVGKWDAGMATPEHTPLGRGFETWVGYFQHANDYWRKSMPFQATGDVDNCLNHFKDIFMHNSTYRGGVRDGVTASAQCSKDPEKEASCYEEFLFLQRAQQVVMEHDISKPDAPLFLFYAFHLLHTPLQVPSSYLDLIDKLVAADGGHSIESKNRRLLAAMVLYMDDAVGTLVKALKDRDMWKDTLFIFAADNGGAIYEPGSGNNHPHKGGKYTDWEGGVRTNSFVSGGFVPVSKRGSSFEGVVSIADWYGTLCELAGAPMADKAAAAANGWLQKQGLPLLRPVDSVPQWEFILNGTNGRPDSLHLSEQAVLKWPYKLVTGRQVYSVWQGPLYPNCTTISSLHAGNGPDFQDVNILGQKIDPAKDMDKVTWAATCDTGCLFNVQADPTEHHNLAGQPEFAGTLQHLQSELRRLNANVFQPGRGTPSVAACEVSIDNGGFYGPFVDADGWYSPSPAPDLRQRLENMALRATLKVADSQAVAGGINRFAKVVAPIVNKVTSQKLDTCTKEGAINEDSVETVVI